MYPRIYKNTNLGAALKRINNVSTPLFYNRSSKNTIGGTISELSNLYDNNLVNVVDRSHYGVIDIVGPRARRFLNRIILSDMNNLGDNKCFNSVILNEKGGIKDYIHISSLTNDKYRMISTPNNSRKIFRHLSEHLDDDVLIREKTNKQIITVLGINSCKTVSSLIKKLNLSNNDNLKLFESIDFNEDINITRNINCGINAYDIVIDSHAKEDILNYLIMQNNVRFAGYDAYNMANLEAGVPVYGSDISEEINPIEARLKWMIPKATNGQTLTQNIIGSKHIYNKDGYILRYPSVRVKIYSLDKNASLPKPHESIMSVTGNNLGYLTNIYFSVYHNSICGYGYIDLLKSFETTNLYHIRNMNKQVIINNDKYHLEIM